MAVVPRRGTALHVRVQPAVFLLLVCAFLDVAARSGPVRSEQGINPSWKQLISQASALGLPTRFLGVIADDFVTLEFEDLHAFAAEYHPDEHRMVLNRTLSFNAAGGALRSLTSLTHREIGTLYHELFHAYLDYVRTHPDRARADHNAARLLPFAESQQLCRYQTVNIAPIVQRPAVTEPRYLNEKESWEALNETWAVFIGWAIWSRLESQGQARSPASFDRWIKRLEKADRDGELIGYYEPTDPSERAIAWKRYLARSDRISAEEVKLLLETVLEVSPGQASRAAKSLRSNLEQKSHKSDDCQGKPSAEPRAQSP
jgi:hypothetical protein